MFDLYRIRNFVFPTSFMLLLTYNFKSTPKIIILQEPDVYETVANVYLSVKFARYVYEMLARKQCYILYVIYLLKHVV